jgi:hypothetical protein
VYIWCVQIIKQSPKMGITKTTVQNSSMPRSFSALPPFVFVFAVQLGPD